MTDRFIHEVTRWEIRRERDRRGESFTSHAEALTCALELASREGGGNVIDLDRDRKVRASYTAHP